MTARYKVASQEISFEAPDGRIVHGTLARPIAPGQRFPAVLLLAGSGPTDRNWSSPGLVGPNHSGRMLAEALAARGVISLRFDKLGTGKTPAPQSITLDSYRDEAAAALARLQREPGVSSHSFIAGHSEGGLHAIRLAQLGESRLSGLILLSAMGTDMKTVLLRQLTDSFAAAPGFDQAGVESQMKPIRTAFDAFLAGKAVDLSQFKIPQIRGLLASLFFPATRELSRGLLTFDNAVQLAKVAIPICIVNGDRDVQVDVERDARALYQAAKAAGRNAKLAVIANVDHVLKTETRPLADIKANRAALVTHYNAAGRELSAAVVEQLLRWIQHQTQQ